MGTMPHSNLYFLFIYLCFYTPLKKKVSLYVSQMIDLSVTICRALSESVDIINYYILTSMIDLLIDQNIEDWMNIFNTE